MTGGVVLTVHTKGREREMVLVGAWVGPEIIVNTEMDCLTWVGGG